jgi:pimeloyl-ACP methyl ester carboxylesterase
MMNKDQSSTLLMALAANVTGVIVPLSGHWIPEEQPEFVINQLSNFFGRNTTNSIR